MSITILLVYFIVSMELGRVKLACCNQIEIRRQRMLEGTYSIIKEIVIGSINPINSA